MGKYLFVFFLALVSIGVFLTIFFLGRYMTQIEAVDHHAGQFVQRYDMFQFRWNDQIGGQR